MKMNNYEMIAIYFDSVLLPEQSKTIRFIQSYKHEVAYGLYLQGSNIMQRLTYQEIVYPLLPYKVEGAYSTLIRFPDSSTFVGADWGEQQADNSVLFDQTKVGLSFLTPFLENLDGSSTSPTPALTFDDTTISRLEVSDLTREIFISPWGVVQVTEKIDIINTGGESISTLKVSVPGPARGVYVSDYLGEILGTSLTPEVNYTDLKYKDLSIDLTTNRAKILPSSKFTFNMLLFLHLLGSL